MTQRLWNELPGPRARVDIDSPQTAGQALDTAVAILRDSDRQQTDSRTRPDRRGEAQLHRGHAGEGHGAHEQHPADGTSEPAAHHMDPAGPQDAPRHAGNEHGPTAHHGHRTGRVPSTDSPHPQHHRTTDRPRQEPTEQQSAGTGHGNPGTGAHVNHDAAGHGGNHQQHGGHRSTGHDEGHDTSQHHGNHGMEHRHDAHETTHGTDHYMTNAGTRGGGHAGHAGMGHGAMNMAPAGIPLAIGGEDRDGLELDALHVRLGPVLAHWPAGLVLRCTLQGDVILDADASLIDADQPVAEDDGRGSTRPLFAARRCDNAAGLLELAGFNDIASHARRLRDALLNGDAHTGPQLDRLARMARRSWLLRWSLRRLGPVTDQDVARWHLPDTLRGDTRDRLLAMLDRAAQALAGRNGHLVAEQPRVPIDAVAELVRGWDLAAARLIVASLDLDMWTADRAVSRV
ncbi:hypothetical protein [Micromonospora globbae]|nr:hypothetical protein [Micromonospora globbae]